VYTQVKKLILITYCYQLPVWCQMINTHVINFITSAHTTAVDDKYRLDSPFSSCVDDVREYRMTKTRLEVWKINKTSEKYLMKFGLDVNWIDFMFPYTLFNFIYINVKKSIRFVLIMSSIEKRDTKKEVKKKEFQAK